MAGRTWEIMEMRDSRRDAETARTIDIALVLQKLRGTEVATEYLRSAQAPEPLIVRVLSSGSCRASMMIPADLCAVRGGMVPEGREAQKDPRASAEPDAPDEPNEPGGQNGPGGPREPPAPGGICFYRVAGRRRDIVRAAVVQAAIGLAGQLDTARAERLLRREEVPDETIARVLAGDDSRRRMR